ncbi:response regulator transcription factor [Kibdelosporangium philippinense]|uniref:Response regulator transcription factor n=1 Tax=Kibdelosporangium philippinense TaxID=211113 RepID=A0ABS8ZAF6_9PSEU|nr:response regulator transcription factor [Kibdelosporangium philippinense]MCE7004849.1 response regulator transcription factor [Kibdelosporangium philippinense]
MIRVAVVDDHTLVREGLGFVLNTHADITVVAQCASGEELLALALDEIDVILLDLYMPGMDGLETLRQIGPTPKTLILTTVGKDRDIRQALSLGAGGFVLKDSTGSELATAVRTVHCGMTVISPAAATSLSIHQQALTPRERDVLSMLGRGLSNRDIADELGLAERTVKVHVGNVLAKLGVPSRTQAALKAETVLNQGTPAGAP